MYSSIDWRAHVVPASRVTQRVDSGPPANPCCASAKDTPRRSASQEFPHFCHPSPHWIGTSFNDTAPPANSMEITLLTLVIDEPSLVVKSATKVWPSSPVGSPRERDWIVPLI